VEPVDTIIFDPVGALAEFPAAPSGRSGARLRAITAAEAQGSDAYQAEPMSTRCRYLAS
jgi:hypothetical protein